jgi:pimeloyl-ACP methyl ester carboxylesterase
MPTVESTDGTTIAYDRRGSGPPVVLVGGAFNDRGTVAGLAEALAPSCTAYTYDRRGRGEQRRQCRRRTLSEAGGRGPGRGASP